MKASLVRLALAASTLVVAALHAQPSATPATNTPTYTQTLAYVRVPSGKGAEYEKFLAETTRKVAQLRADSGEIISWTVLRAVTPSGLEARANYLISTVSEGAPPVPTSESALATAMKKAGVAMSVTEFVQRRSSLSTLVATEMWRPRVRVGAPKKGHYLYINMMKVHDMAAYSDFEQTVWRPMAEEWVKQGAMSGWLFATRMLPGGTDTPYAAYSADIFATWDAAFAARSAQAVYEKINPGKKWPDVVQKYQKLRDLARRELWVVVDRVEKSS